MQLLLLKARTDIIYAKTFYYSELKNDNYSNSEHQNLSPLGTGSDSYFYLTSLGSPAKWH